MKGKVFKDGQEISYYLRVSFVFVYALYRREV